MRSDLSGNSVFHPDDLYSSIEKNLRILKDSTTSLKSESRMVPMSRDLKSTQEIQKNSIEDLEKNITMLKKELTEQATLLKKQQDEMKSLNESIQEQGEKFTIYSNDLQEVINILHSKNITLQEAKKQVEMHVDTMQRHISEITTNLSIPLDVTQFSQATQDSLKMLSHDQNQ